MRKAPNARTAASDPGGEPDGAATSSTALDRRTVLRRGLLATALAIPTVSVVTMAPAVAASCISPDAGAFGFPGGWTSSTVQGTGSAAGVAGFVGTRHVVSKDNGGLLAPYRVRAVKLFDLCPGTTYTATFTFNTVERNTSAQTVLFEWVAPGGVTAASASYTTVITARTGVTRTIAVTPPVAGTYAIRITHSIPVGVLGLVSGDDITVESPVVVVS